MKWLQNMILRAAHDAILTESGRIVHFPTFLCVYLNIYVMLSTIGIRKERQLVITDRV